MNITLRRAALAYSLIALALVVAILCRGCGDAPSDPSRAQSHRNGTVLPPRNARSEQPLAAASAPYPAPILQRCTAVDALGLPLQGPRRPDPELDATPDRLTLVIVAVTEGRAAVILATREDSSFSAEKLQGGAEYSLIALVEREAPSSRSFRTTRTWTRDELDGVSVSFEPERVGTIVVSVPGATGECRVRVERAESGQLVSVAAQCIPVGASVRFELPAPATYRVSTGLGSVFLDPYYACETHAKLNAGIEMRVELSVESAAALSVVVVDHKDTPVPGARCGLRYLRESGWIILSREPDVGGAALARLRPGLYGLTAHAPGYEISSEQIRLAPGSTGTVRVVLRPSNLRFSARLPGAEPGTIYFGRCEDDSWRCAGVWGLDEGSDGAIRYRGLKPGTWELNFNVAGQPALIAFRTAGEDVDLGMVDVSDLAAKGPYGLRIRLQASADSSNRFKALFKRSDWAAGQWRVAWIESYARRGDAALTVTIGDLPSGEYLVALSPIASDPSTFDLSAVERVRLEGDESRVVEVVLPVPRR